MSCTETKRNGVLKDKVGPEQIAGDSNARASDWFSSVVERGIAEPIRTS